MYDIMNMSKLQLPTFKNGNPTVIDISRRFIITPTIVFRYLSVYPGDVDLVGKNMSMTEFIDGIEMSWNYLMCNGKFIVKDPILRESYTTFLLYLKSEKFNSSEILKTFSSEQYGILDNMNKLITSGTLVMDIDIDVEGNMMEASHQISIINLKLIMSSDISADVSKFIFRMLVDSVDRVSLYCIKHVDMINWIGCRLKRQFGEVVQCRSLDSICSWSSIYDMPNDEYLVELNRTYDLIIATVECVILCQMVDNIPSITKEQKMRILDNIDCSKQDNFGPRKYPQSGPNLQDDEFVPYGPATGIPSPGATYVPYGPKPGPYLDTTMEHLASILSKLFGFDGCDENPENDS